MEFASREWVEIVRPATQDEDMAVRETAQAIAARLEIDLSESLETTGLMDRMLLLRAIRLFDSLLPSDLERLAMAAAEKHFAAGEGVFAQGDEGGEMLIIAGEIVYRTKDGRTLARLGQGQHLGELTVLSGKPRPADAVAVTAVSALSIDSPSLNNLILERPAVARQMLASLAAQLADAVGTVTTIEPAE
jgi:CRP-like cAMP-binding protein